jgi:hypothetical protein
LLRGVLIFKAVIITGNILESLRLRFIRGIDEIVRLLAKEVRLPVGSIVVKFRVELSIAVFVVIG